MSDATLGLLLRRFSLKVKTQTVYFMSVDAWIALKRKTRILEFHSLGYYALTASPQDANRKLILKKEKFLRLTDTRISSVKT